MEPKSVNPKDWQWDKSYPIRILFENDDYSMVWGKYKGKKCLGARWNGGSKRGYPGQGEHPTWYIEPDIIASSIIQRLYNLALDTGNKQYLDNILFAFNELDDKLR